jgi:hypothetical protein
MYNISSNAASRSLINMDFIAYHNKTAKPIRWTYTVEELEQKLGTN